MDRQSRSEARDTELMGKNIVDIFLSEELLRDPYKTPKDKETRLRRFIHNQEDICNPRLLDSGEHGVVVLASIKNIEYALKVFKRWKQPGPVFYPYKEAIYTSPLACESRALARLNSLNMNGTWAARCYGWMELSDTQFEVIAKATEPHSLSRWVIVKEYKPIPTKASDIPEIYAKFDIAKRAKILPQDVRVENYRGASIVDLSSALTYPCPEWSEYLFEFFYKETVQGVFDWFPSSLPETTASSFLLLTGTFVLVLCGSLVLRRIR